MSRNIFGLDIIVIEPHCIPTHGTTGSAGVDLRVREYVELPAHSQKLVGTGIAIYIKDPNYVGLVFARSSLPVKWGVTLANGVGVIDSDYQGEIKLPLMNISDKHVSFQAGERVAQIVFLPIVHAVFNGVKEFPLTERNLGGFGSTGEL